MGMDTVIRSNSLIEASYRLSIQEIRVILLAIQKAQTSSKAITDDTFYPVYANELASFSGEENSYKLLKKVGEHLFERTLTITHDPNGNKLTPPIRTRWIQSDRLYSNGKIEIRFSKDIVPYLSQLSKMFTKVNLKNIEGLTTAYSYRLYELLLQHNYKGARTLTINDLREHLLLQTKYEQFKELNRWIIKPSIASINEHTDINVTYNTIKQGRKITALEFSIQKKHSSKSHEQNIFIQQNALPGESYHQAKKRLAKEL